MQDRIDKRMEQMKRKAEESDDPKAPKTPEEWAYVYGVTEGGVILETADYIISRSMEIEAEGEN